MKTHADLARVSCAICHAPAEVVEDAYPGYRAPSRYQIAQCRGCEVSFAIPTQSDEELYELIYSQSAMIPGYDRYDYYASVICGARSPLDFLAAQEENYWAVREACASLPANAEILDAGSGLGYLAFALAAAGFRATGLDLSEEAVARARRRFGDYYVAADFFEWARRYPQRYDMVVMLELIEHVNDPRRWIDAALRLIKPGGCVLISTPNRRFYPTGTVWETEAPPVHLWWFSPAAIERLTNGSGVTIRYPDFTRCGVAPKAIPQVPIRTVRSPMLDEAGKPVSRLRRLLHRFGLLSLAMSMYRARESRRRARAAASIDPVRRETLAATLWKQT